MPPHSATFSGPLGSSALGCREELPRRSAPTEGNRQGDPRSNYLRSLGSSSFGALDDKICEHRGESVDQGSNHNKTSASASQNGSLLSRLIASERLEVQLSANSTSLGVYACDEKGGNGDTSQSGPAGHQTSLGPTDPLGEPGTSGSHDAGQVVATLGIPQGKERRTTRSVVRLNLAAGGQAGRSLEDPNRPCGPYDQPNNGEVHNSEGDLWSAREGAGAWTTLRHCAGMARTKATRDKGDEVVHNRLFRCDEDSQRHCGKPVLRSLVSKGGPPTCGLAGSSRSGLAGPVRTQVGDAASEIHQPRIQRAIPGDAESGEKLATSEWASRLGKGAGHLAAAFGGTSSQPLPLLSYLAPYALSARPRSRRLRASKAALRRLLVGFCDPRSSLPAPPRWPKDSGAPPDPFPPFPPFDSQGGSGDALPVLDSIDVPPLNVEALLSMEPDLVDALRPLHDLEFFEGLLKPGATLPVHAPMPNIPQEGWSQSLQDWGMATLISDHEMQKPPRFSLPSLETLRPLIFRFVVGRVTDLRHCFYQFPLSPRIAPFFSIPSPEGFLAFCRMPMGWSWAPWVAQRVATAYLRPFLPAAVAIYDDFLLLADSVEECEQKTFQLWDRIKSCNGTIHPKKSNTPANSSFVFLGVLWDLMNKRHRLDKDFVTKWDAWLTVLALGLQLPLRYYWVALGAALYVLRVLFVPLCEVNHLLRWSSVMATNLENGTVKWTTLLTPWPEAVHDLKTVSTLLHKNEWVLFCFPKLLASPSLWTDASSQGWAWILSENTNPLCGAQGLWGQTRAHINVCELLAVWRAVSVICVAQPGYTWSLFCDNTTTLHQLRKGRAQNPLTNRILRDIVSLLSKTESALRLFWVESSAQLADVYTRGKSLRCRTWSTTPLFLSTALCAPSGLTASRILCYPYSLKDPRLVYDKCCGINELQEQLVSGQTEELSGIKSDLSRPRVLRHTAHTQPLVSLV